jgi:ClpP class serine protease
MDQLGSVGSYCTLLDYSGYLEKEGIKMHQIYAPQSVDKNKDYKDAIAGDYSAIEADLKIHVDEFISFVKTARGDKAAANESTWGTGKMFYADEAVKLGLADGIKSFEQVISKAAWLAKRKK